VTALDYILDGLEAELALERELGVRVVECDRASLSPPAPAPVKPEPRHAPPPPGPRHAPPPPVAAPGADADARHPFVFLHDRPLSVRGAEMIEKAVAAMHESPQSAPVVVDGQVPKARVYIVLGALALAKWIPGARAEPGMWVKTPGGADALVTYSPEKIVRYRVVTPAVEKMKQMLWRDLKEVMRRARSQDRRES